MTIAFESETARLMRLLIGKIDQLLAAGLSGV